MNTIFENPEASITQKNDTLFSSKARKYQWLFNGDIIEGATDSFYVPVKNGRYKVMTIDRFRCAATSPAYVWLPPVSISKNTISVSPNPVHDVLHLHSNIKNASQIIICDLTGTKFFEVPFTNIDQTIFTQKIPPGVYSLQLLNDKKQVLGSLKIINDNYAQPGNLPMRRQCPSLN